MPDDKVHHRAHFGFAAAVVPGRGRVLFETSGEVARDTRVIRGVLGNAVVAVRVESFAHDLPFPALAASRVRFDVGARVKRILDPGALGIGHAHPCDLSVAIHVGGAVLAHQAVAVVVNAVPGCAIIEQRRREAR